MLIEWLTSDAIILYYSSAHRVSNENEQQSLTTVSSIDSNEEIRAEEVDQYCSAIKPDCVYSSYPVLLLPLLHIYVYTADTWSNQTDKNESALGGLL